MRFPLESTAVQWVWDSQQALNKLYEIQLKRRNAPQARFLFFFLPEKAVPLPEVETELEATAAVATLADACGAVYRMPRISLELDHAARQAFTRYEANAQRKA